MGDDTIDTSVENNMIEKRTETTAEDLDKLMGVFGELSAHNLWSKVKPGDFTTRRFAEGNVNDIICCELTPEARKRLCKSPKDRASIVVKYSPAQIWFPQQRIDLVANNTTISHHKLGPALLFINDHCMINELVPNAVSYSHEHDHDEDTVRLLARKLAQFHLLPSPVSREGYNKFCSLMDEFEQMPIAPIIYGKKYLYFIEKDEELREKYHSAFSELDMKQQNDYVKQLMDRSGSPIVFAHGDFNRNNRLVSKCPIKQTQEIYFVDFDYSTWNHRGLDFGRYFSNYRHVDDLFGDEGFPSDEEMALFLGEYRSECARIHGGDPEEYLSQEENSLEQLIRESKIYTLNGYNVDLFFCLFMYSLNPAGDRRDYFLQSALNRLNGYKKLKQRFTKDGTLTD